MTAETKEEIIRSFNSFDSIEEIATKTGYSVWSVENVIKLHYNTNRMRVARERRNENHGKKKTRILQGKVSDSPIRL